MNDKKYFVAKLKVENISSEEILSGNYQDDIKKRIDEIIKIEEPIYSSLIIKRLLNSYGIKKCGARLSSYLEPIISSLPYPYYIEKDEKVFFLHTISCTSYRPCSENERYSYQIPYIEGAVLIEEILKEKNLNKKQLLNEFAIRFKYKRKGSQVVTLFNESYDYYKSKNK